MDARQFVANWKLEKTRILASTRQPGSLAAGQIAALALSEAQSHQLSTLLDTLLSDAMYTLLLGLDGCASIGDDQHAFSIHDEDGQPIADIEAEAYAQFHGTP